MRFKVMKYSCLTICIVIFFGCKKKDVDPNLQNSNLASAPEAKQEFDNSSGGIYKSALLGSSGYCKIVLQEGRYQVILKIDSELKILTTTGLAGWSPGSTISNVVFENGDWNVHFSVNGDGVNPNVNIYALGHTNIGVVTLKETSSELVKIYEGTYTGSETGAFNLVIKNNNIKGIWRKTETTTNDFFNGIIKGSSISLTVTSTIIGSGTMIGDSFSGSWSNGWTGNWKVNRTY